MYKYAQITIKHPVLVNDKHDLSEIHKCYKKFGLKQTLTELRQIFWVVKKDVFCSRSFEKIFICRGLEEKTYRQPITPPLTPSRLNNSRAFVTTGIDNFGNLYVKMFMSTLIKHMGHAIYRQQSNYVRFDTRNGLISIKAKY